jgi:hypothetical protein
VGIDIYFQAFDGSNVPLGERQELRCWEIYQLMSSWFGERRGSAPGNGEHVSIGRDDWKEIAPKVRLALIEAEAELEASIQEQRQATTGRSRQQIDVDGVMNAAKEVADEWMPRIWPEGATRVEYWFTN